LIIENFVRTISIINRDKIDDFMRDFDNMDMDVRFSVNLKGFSPTDRRLFAGMMIDFTWNSAANLFVYKIQ
jgi:hypothetical protein